MATNGTPKKARKRGGKRAGAGRPSLPSEEYRGHRLAFRVNDDELQIFERRLRESGKSASEYLRERAVG